MSPDRSIRGISKSILSDWTGLSLTIWCDFGWTYGWA